MPVHFLTKVSVAGKKLADFPEILKEWDYEKNGHTAMHRLRRAPYEEIKISELPAGSNKKVWWKCDVAEDHSWEVNIAKRTVEGTGCPFCAGKRPSITNRLDIKNPKVSDEFDLDANGGLKPSDFVEKSAKKVWWVCKENSKHKWKAAIENRTYAKRPSGCPYCANKAVNHENNLLVKFPEVAKQWHPTKNGNVKPEDIYFATYKKYWWKCDIGEDHVWEAAVEDRTGVHYKNKKRKMTGTGCPACTGRQVADSNRLSIQFPRVAKEWHPTKNGDLQPDEFSKGSKEKVWWKCHNGHEWESTITNRARGRDCPDCKLKGVSKIEVRLAFEFYSIFGLKYKHKPRVEINGKTWLPDILIEPMRLIIEYDGRAYHGDILFGDKGRKITDTVKTEEFSKKGWTVIRIREEPLQKITDNDIIVNPHDRNYKQIVNDVLAKAIELGKTIPKYEKYIQNDRPVAKRAADEYIAKLQKEAEQETLNF